MKRLTVIVYTYIGLLIGSIPAFGQCCSGGVPMAGNIGMPVGESKTFQVSFNLDHNSLENFLTGSEEATELLTRVRSTTSYLLEGSYSFSKLLSLDLLVPYVVQRREINSNQVSTSGIGDMVILPKVTVGKKFTIGTGVKLPLGNTEESNNGFPLIIDLQPGSGAFDLINHLSYTVSSINFLPTMSMVVTANYRNTGTNKNYLGNSTYRFGNEIQVIAGLSNRFTFFKSALMDLSMRLRFRHASQDISNDTKISNTGGRWLFLNPGLSYLITPALSYQFNAEVPLVQHVEGTQLSPTFRVNTGVFLTLNRQKNETLQ